MMSTRAVTPYMQSFLWITFLFVVIQTIQFNVEILFVDFIHGNPHRPLSNALSMMEIDTPIFAIVDVIGCLLVLALSQCLQAALIHIFQPAYGCGARYVVFPALPVTAVVTWYCYDYLTPSNVCFGGCDMPLYEHGISISRYLKALAFQIPITLFSFLYFAAGLRGAPKWPLIAAALAIAVVAGGVWGYFSALGQYRFLQ
jgi:hypothetical protein